MFRIELLAGAVMVLALGQPAIAQNMAMTLQIGVGNHSTIGQFVGPNRADVVQFGVSNTSVVTQSGRHDVATVVQVGEGNDGTVTQTTDHATTMVFQSSNPFGVNQSSSKTVSSSLGSVSVQFSTHSN